WNFGDGSANATTQNPTHTYSAAGNYTVTLTVSNSYGSSTIRKTNYISVSNPPPFLSGGWSYRKLHTISGSPSGDLTDYQVRFTVWNTTGTDSGENVYLGSNVTPDFRDVRFTTTDNTVLPS
ncbi:MAG: PKD domain-containing protein, partial [Methanolinea sp.]|nr:PKD domain-containing protein [Methanolinea sp.]